MGALFSRVSLPLSGFWLKQILGERKAQRVDVFFALRLALSRNNDGQNYIGQEGLQNQ